MRVTVPNYISDEIQSTMSRRAVRVACCSELCIETAEEEQRNREIQDERYDAMPVV